MAARSRRITEENVLELRSRINILKYIFDNPGCSGREIRGNTRGKSTETHLKGLKKYGLIKREANRHGNSYYVNFSNSDYLESYGLAPELKYLFNAPKKNPVIKKENIKNYDAESLSSSLSEKEISIVKYIEKMDKSKIEGKTYPRDIAGGTGMHLAEIISYLEKIGGLLSFEMKNGRKCYHMRKLS